jgi:uncharacterized membrane protein
MDIQRLLLLVTILLTALAAGLFYSWSCSVMPGLARVPDQVFLTSMQSMNRAILNPVFFASFFGAAILLPICAWSGERNGLIIVATVVYWGGVMGVTMLGNVPLNNMIEAINIPSSTPEQLAQHRAAFEARWVSLNVVRTIANTLALILLLIAAIKPSNG